MTKKIILDKIKQLGIISATVASFWLTHTPRLLALPQEAIIKKLQPIPVFTIADEQGSPLIASGEGNEKVAGVFISKQDANGFVERLKKENPDIGGKVKVVPISLAEIYELSQKNAGNKDAVQFAYVPSQQQMDQAKQLNNQYQGGVPLFVAKAGEDQGYLTIKQNETEVIPFFFDKQQVQQLVEDFKKQQPSLANSIKIEVVILEGVLGALKEGEDEMLNRIVLWPSKESIDFIRANTSQK